MKNRFFKIGLAALAGTVLFVSCRKPAQPETTLSDTDALPVLPEKVDDYPQSKNDYLAALGRVLFYDKELSANKNISCGSCHQQAHAFADVEKFSLGTNSQHAKRNTPQIFSRTGKFFWDGRANSMESMVLMPVVNDREMSVQNVNDLIERLNSIDYYEPLVSHAFYNTTELDSIKLKAAIAEFMKNLAFSNNKFNQSEKNGAQLTAQEQEGKTLFFGSAGCANCHRLSPVAGNEYYSTFQQSHNIGLDADNPDPGVGAITKNEKDNGAFLTPVLFNVEYTAPYMHDGRFSTLEEVIEHYDNGVKNNPNLDFNLKDGNQPKKLNLQQKQKDALVAFLKTLSDPAVLTDQKFSDPFVRRN